MMKVLFIVRSTLFNVRGGDTVQVMETAKALEHLGVEVNICKTNAKIDYKPYDFLHFFNITRPADILLHITRSHKKFVVSTLLIDYTVYDKYNRHGLAGKIFTYLPSQSIEYLKTLARFILKKDTLISKSYLWKGQYGSIKQILRKASCVFVHSEVEYNELVELYGETLPFVIIQNGVDIGMFKYNNMFEKEHDMVVCAARIEGIKNQYNLIKAINGTRYRLFLIGDPAPNQNGYYKKCKKIAKDNIIFVPHLSQNKLVNYYAKAKVHVLPSWFEICGLSSLEAAVMGCRVVITANGYAKEYFGESAYYCDPSDPTSIYNAITSAAIATSGSSLKDDMASRFTWRQTAEKILGAYKEYIK